MLNLVLRNLKKFEGPNYHGSLAIVIMLREAGLRGPPPMGDRVKASQRISRIKSQKLTKNYMPAVGCVKFPKSSQIFSASSLCAGAWSENFRNIKMSSEI